LVNVAWSAVFWLDKGEQLLTLYFINNINTMLQLTYCDYDCFRNEIASCIEIAYEKISFPESTRMLFCKGPSAMTAYAIEVTAGVKSSAYLRRVDSTGI